MARLPTLVKRSITFYADRVGTTRWLTAQEQTVWRSYLEATSRLADELAAQLQADAGIPHTYYEILVRLSEAPDRSLRMSELASRAISSRSRMSHAVTRLAEQGWIERIDCPTDRRGQIARLTDAGYDALVEIAPGHVTCVRETLFEALTPDQVSQLGVIAEAIVANLDASRSRVPAGD